MHEIQPSDNLPTETGGGSDVRFSSRPSALSVHEIPVVRGGTEGSFAVGVCRLTPDLAGALFEELETHWTGPRHFIDELKDTVTTSFEQEKAPTSDLLTVEYYAFTDSSGTPFGITGLFTTDLRDATGLSASTNLDPNQHHLTTSLAWFAISQRYRGLGIGSWALDWIEERARAKGAKMMSIETSDHEYEEAANRIYRGKGYSMGFDVADYFGPERDMYSYYQDIAEIDTSNLAPEEEITPENIGEVLKLAQAQLSPARFEEFQNASDIFLQHKKDQPSLLTPHSFVIRDANGMIESFCIGVTNKNYMNMLTIYWDVCSAQAQEKFILAARGLARSLDKDIVLIQREGPENNYLHRGFRSANDGVGPHVYGKDVGNKFLFYTKRLDENDTTPL